MADIGVDERQRSKLIVPFLFLSPYYDKIYHTIRRLANFEAVKIIYNLNNRFKF